MKKLCLIISGGVNGMSPDEDCLIASWSIREVAPGFLSIPVILDEKLHEIRKEHMRWAYETGLLPIEGSENLASAFECGESPSMWWTSLLYERHPKLSPNLYAIYRLRVVELLIEEYGFDLLEIHGGDRTLDCILSDLANSLGIAYKNVISSQKPKSSFKGWLVEFYERMPAPLRSMARYAHWWITIRRRLPYARRAFPDHPDKNKFLPATITTYFPNLDLSEAAQGRFRSRYWEDLHKALNEKAHAENPDGPHFVHWLLIRFPSPQLNFKQCLELRAKFAKDGRDGSSYLYLEELLATKDLFLALFRWCKISLKSAAMQSTAATSCKFAGSKLNFWPLMKKQWVESFRGWRCLERCLQNRAFKNYYATAGRQRWNLFPLENCPWERMLTLAVRENNAGPVYGTQHSIIRPTDFRYFDDPRTFNDRYFSPLQPDVIGGNGAAAMYQWHENSMPINRSMQVEALRYLYLVEHEEKWPPIDGRQLPPEPGEPLAMPCPSCLLVLTSFFADETTAHLELLGRALDSGLLANWEITIKPHPYLAVNWWLEKRPAAQLRHIRLADGPISMELKPGVTVWTSNSTTTALEAALYGLPLMVMRPANDFDLCPIQNIPGLARTGSLEDVKRELPRLRALKLPPDYLDLNPQLTAWRKLLNLD